jgi:hypothetical protein
MASRKKKASTASAPIVLAVRLRIDELETLIEVADYYQRSMGFMRHIVRLGSGPEMRRRFRFVAEESQWLGRFAETTRDQMIERGDRERSVSMTVPALVAFWGRLLASLHSSRARRKMSAAQIASREELAKKLGDVAADLWRRQPAAIDTAMETRRSTEREWMRDALSAGKGAARGETAERSAPPEGGTPGR